MDSIPVQQDALDLTVRRTSGACEDSAKNENNTGSWFEQHGDVRKILEEYTIASGRPEEEENRPIDSYDISKRGSPRQSPYQNGSKVSSRKRFCNEDLRRRPYSPSCRADLEQETHFPFHDVPLTPPGGLPDLSGLSQVSDIELVSGGDTVIPQGIVRTVNGVSVRLQEEELWNAFRALQTEMIINRGGRRMFPHIIVGIEGLDPDETYSVAMEIVDADDRRYKYVNNTWMAMGIADPGPARHMYVHPDSPNSGAVWTKNFVSFAKVRLTNNKESWESILLHSMHKYMVAVIIKEEATNGRVMRFDFTETTFIAVTAYQNNAITRLKIQNNPFAKAFRAVTASSKRSDNVDVLLGSKNRNTCNARRVPKGITPREGQFSIGQFSIHDMYEQSIRSGQSMRSGLQPRCDFTIPSAMRFGCYGGQASLYLPWLSNLGLGYPLPAMMPMWYPDRRYCSNEDSRSQSPKSGEILADQSTLYEKTLSPTTDCI